MRACVLAVRALGCLALAACDADHRSEGERLARAYCAACHAFPEPQLLTKETWRAGVLPQMAPRVGAAQRSLFDEASRNPHVMVLRDSVSADEWEQIVGYYLHNAPDTLRPESPVAAARIDSSLFSTAAFVPGLQSSGIVTLLHADTSRRRIFVGDAGSNTLRVFDWNRRALSSRAVNSPPTGLVLDGNSVLVLESGILSPNDDPRGMLVRYELSGDSLRFSSILIDSLFRPVFITPFDFDRDGRNEFLICEYGNNRGRLALYAYDGTRYTRRVLDAQPGAIRAEIRDMTGDHAPDIVALFAQGDERIVLFENDGQGRFSGQPRVLARFPPVYGSMHFSMHDFTGDGRLDIVYVNGDNFDYSRVLKPYHGIRILENDGRNTFQQRFFFPLHGAARAEVRDFDRDSDLDLIITSNFSDRRSPERGIMYLRNVGRYEFQPHAFPIASGNQWNLTVSADLNDDGWPDVIVGAMDLESIATLQGRSPRARSAKDAVLFFENTMGNSAGGRRE